jgi:hypothetical protein
LVPAREPMPLDVGGIAGCILSVYVVKYNHENR